MAANTAPIYTLAPDIQWISGVTAANTNANISSGTSYLVFTADATNGGFCREIRFKVAPGNNSSATVLRVWLNNGSSPTTGANNTLLAEVGLPSTTATSTAALPDFVIPINMALPAGYKLYVSLGTGLGSSTDGFATAIAGKY